MGAITRSGRFIYRLEKRTNTKSVHRFMVDIVNVLKSHGIEGEEITFVLDKHSAHRSPAVKKYLESKRIHFMYTPANCSQFNSIELVWNLFKINIRKRMVNKIDWSQE